MERSPTMHEEGIKGEGIQQIFIPISDEMQASRLELQKTVGVLIKTSGQPTYEDMIDGINATSKRLSQLTWRPFREGRDYLIKFPDKQTLTYFVSRTTSLECPRGSFRVNRWKGGEGRNRQFKFPQCRWIIIKGLPPYAWSRNSFACMIKSFAQLVDVDQDTINKSRIDQARILIGCQSLKHIPNELEVILGEQVGMSNWKLKA